jgi:hypothetical protein
LQLAGGLLERIAMEFLNMDIGINIGAAVLPSQGRPHARV